jgi:Flp pilus assembly protein TadB
MILAILSFIFISLLSFGISRLVRNILAHRKRQAYFNQVLGGSVVRKELQSDVFARLESKVQHTKIGSFFLKIQDQYDIAEEVKLSQVLIALGGTLFICWNLSGFLNISPIPFTLLAILVEIAGAGFILRKRKLVHQLDTEFPKILESVAGIFQINPDLKQSFLTSESVIQNKVGKRFLNELNQISLIGVPMIESLEMISKKWVYQPLFFFISAIKLHQSSGGDLAQLFRLTAQSIRRQQHNKKAMESVMFQNKVSAIIVCSLVPVILFFSMMLSENYRTVMTTEPAARALVIGSGIWWMIGVIVMWRMLRVRV